MLYTKIEYGLYLMIFFLPVIYWDAYFYQLEIPFIDYISLAVLLAFTIKTLGNLLFKRDKFKLRMPLLIPFLLFFASVLTSDFLSAYISSNIWYTMRWILFFYLAYVVLPVNLIKNEKILKNSLLYFFTSSLFISLMGIISLFQQDWQHQFIRVLPISIFGVFPLGDNHNLIAEVFIVSICFTQALKYWYKSLFADRILNIITVVQTFLLLATFSRAAWIALGVEALLYFFFTNKNKKKFLVAVILGAIIVSPLAFYMYRLQSDFSIGGSSTQSRLVMSEVAWKRFLDKPFFGNGSGQFMNLISDDIRYIAKYGEPLDSHGVWQKVLAENGIFGVLTFGILFFSIMILFYRVLKKNRHEEKILLPIFLGGVGIFVIEFFNTSYYNGKLWLPIAFGLAAINIIKAKNKSRYGKN